MKISPLYLASLVLPLVLASCGGGTPAPVTAVPPVAPPVSDTVAFFRGSSVAITISWTAVTGASYYQVWRHNENDNSAAALQTTGQSQITTTFTNIGLSADSRYYYWIKACNLANCSAFGASTVVSTEATNLIPRTPGAPTPVVVDSTIITIRWAAVTGASYYQLWRHNEDDRGSAVELTSGQSQIAATFTDTGLSADSRYFYWVNACNAGRCSASSTAANIKAAEIAPRTPGAPTPFVESTTSITINWDRVGNTSYYQVWRNNTNNSASSTELTSDRSQTTTFTDTGLDIDSQYYYWLKACNTADCSAFSIGATATTFAPNAIPLPPATPALVVDGDTAITVSWNRVGNAEYYEVWRQTVGRPTANAGRLEQITDASQTSVSFTDTTLSAQTQYFYWVKACNTNGCSPLSSGTDATTDLPIPRAVTAIVISDSEIMLSWDMAPEILYYQVWRHSADDSASAVELTSGQSQTTTSFTNNGLSEATQYYYWITACNTTDDCSDFSASTAATTIRANTSPSLPDAPTLSVDNSSTITLNWGKADNATYYQVWRHSADDVTAAVEQTAQSSQRTTRFVDTGLNAQSQYFYWIKACNLIDCSAFSASANAITAFAPPAAPTLVVDSGVAITISWARVPNTDYYQLWRHSADDADSAVELTSGQLQTTTSFTDSNLDEGRQYYYWLAVCNTNACSTFSASANALTWPAAPPAPILTVDNDTQISLSWQATTSADRFEIHRDNDDDPEGAIVVDSALSTTSYTDMGLSAATQYYYWIKACNASGCSAFTGSASATTAPPPPDTLTFAVNKDAEIVISWTTVTDASHYQVWRHTADVIRSASIQTIDQSQTTTSFTSVSLLPGTQYYYWIQACDANGCSALRDSASAFTWPVTPPTPRPAGRSNSRIVVSWVASIGATHYEFLRNTSDAIEDAVAITIVDFVDAGLSANSTYYYWIRACNASGCSAYSASASGTTGPQSPPRPRLVVDNVSTVTVSWEAIAHATYYQVWSRMELGFTDVSENDSAEAEQLTSAESQTATTFTDNGLTEDATYYYWVKACNANGCSDFVDSTSAHLSAFTAALDSNLTFTQPNEQTDTANWAPQTSESNDGIDAVESGTVEAGSSACFETTVAGPGVVSFFWKVGSEENNDYLNFSIDNNEINRISGDIDWQQQTHRIGSLTEASLQWCYSKNITIDTMPDRAYIDQINYTPTAMAIQTRPGFLRFVWNAVTGTDHYRLQSSTDGGVSFTGIAGADRIDSTDTAFELLVAAHRVDWTNSQYRVQSCNADESICNEVATEPLILSDSIAASWFVKASNTGANDVFGSVLAISDDASTLAVGARGENQNSGAVYVYTRSPNNWLLQAYIKAANTSAGDEFGSSVALSPDGNTLAVGAPREDNTSGEVEGAAYVFTRSRNSWAQQAYIKAANADAGDEFGSSVALSPDGNILAVGAPREDNNAGAVYVYTRSYTSWTQQAYIKALDASAGDNFGNSVALGSEGGTLAVAANREDSNGQDSGAVYVFNRSNITWTQQIRLKAPNPDRLDEFGASIALSSEGDTLAVGAVFEDGDNASTTEDANDNTTDAGAVYVYTRSDGNWAQEAYIKALNAGESDLFGVSVALSADGNFLAVGASGEGSNSTTIGGDATDDSADGAGAVYTFVRSNADWTQQRYIKAANAGAGDEFGNSVALSSDANTLAASALREDSNATSINGGSNNNNNNSGNSGAAYIYGPGITAPTAPGAPALVVDSGTTVTVSWFEVGSATHYQVWRHSADDSTMATRLTADSLQATTSFTDTGLVADTQYFYWIQACNALSCSALGPSTSIVSDPLVAALDTTLVLTQPDSQPLSANWRGQTSVSFDGIDAAQSGVVSDGDSSCFETSVSKPGAVSFYWKVSSAADQDFLTFSIDGLEQNRISGDVNWQEQSHRIDTLTSATLKWCYSKSSADAQGTNRGYVDQISYAVRALAVQPGYLRFTWDAVPGIDHYRLQSSTDGGVVFTTIPEAIRITETTYDLPIIPHLLNWAGRQRYRILSCNIGNIESACDVVASEALSLSDSAVANWYLKTSAADASDGFGGSVAISGDGNSLAVATHSADSGDAASTGTITVFTRSRTTWVEQDTIKASNIETGDQFGFEISLSNDGSTMAVGAPGEDGGRDSTVENTNDSAPDAGAVYIFTRSDGNWQQEAYIKAANADGGDEFGASACLSHDGSTMAVGAPGEDGGRGSTVESENNSALDAGAVYVYTRSNGNWAPEAYIKATNADGGDEFGASVCLNGDGNSLAVGAPGEDAIRDSTVESDNNSALDAGAAYVYTRSDGNWAPEAYIKATNADEGDEFGTLTRLSNDGNTLAVGVPGEDSNRNSTLERGNNNAPDAGAVYVFARSDGNWAPEAYIKAANVDGGDEFGTSTRLSNDGNTLVVGAPGEDSSSTAINGSPYNNDAPDSGAAYAFTRSQTGWAQRTFIKAPNTDEGDQFGISIALSAEGNTLAVGAPFEDSSSTAIGADQSNDDAPDSGAVYLYGPAFIASPVPGPPTVIPDDETFFTISWAPSPNAARYQIWRHTANDSSKAVNVTRSEFQSGRLFTDSNISENTVYFYWIKACNTVSCSAFSASANSAGVTRIPSAPLAPTLVASNANTISVSWAGVADANYYQLWRGSEDDSTMATLQTPETSQDTLEFTDTGLSAFTTYFYWITACNILACSEFSASASAITRLVAPTLAVDSGAQISLSWPAVMGADHYEIHRGTSNDSAVATAVTTFVIIPYYVNSDLTANTTYYYWIRVCYADNCSAFSDSASATTSPAPPAAPTLTISTSSSVMGRWNAVAGASHYQVWRHTTDDSAMATQLMTGLSQESLSFRNSGRRGTTYFYWIKACNASTCSAFSASASATPNRLSSALDTSLLFTQPDAQSSTEDWAPQAGVTNDGIDALRSGTIAAGASSCIQTSVEGPGVFGFYWKVDSEEDNDYLNFSIAGIEQNRISGDIDWHEQTRRISSQESTILRWCYTKNTDTDSGADRAYLDQLSFRPSALTVQPGFLRFAWDAVENTDHYRLQGSNDGGITFTTVSGAATINGLSHDLPVYTLDVDWASSQYRIQACDMDENTCTDVATESLFLSDATAASWYLKAFNARADDQFGGAVALSADGNTLALSATLEDGDSNSAIDNTNENAIGSGAVYVFIRTENTWTLQAYIKAANAEADDNFGGAIALSSDGNTLAVGAPFEDSNSTTIINGQDNNADGIGEDNNSFSDSGAVYVYTRSGANWRRQAYIKAANAEEGDNFGSVISLSSDGNTLAVGAPFEDSNSTTIEMGADNNDASNSGAAYLYARTSDAMTTTWAQQAYIKAANAEMDDNFGSAISLSSDGNTLAVGAPFEDSNSTTIEMGADNNDASNSGAAYLYARTSDAMTTTWAQQAYIKAANAEEDDNFGGAIALNSDGNTLAVGAINEDSNSTTIEMGAGNNDASNSGAAYLYARTSDALTTTWAQQAYIKAANAEAGDNFGAAIALSSDGNNLAASAPGEDSNSITINSKADNNDASDSGAAYLYSRTSDTMTITWAQQAYIKAANAEAGDNFGAGMALNSEGSTVVVGAPFEDSDSTTMNSEAGNNDAMDAGAVYIY